ncbi:YbhB/YbcL family Raf kinase inhibitor-like protein [Fusobacterium varium]|uniref:YbhB/YbcL family Raf kinase inhibitor-like protein n=1 Tax=Fusobacterium varium TaxID=856 RepID=UPI001F29D4F6|nr:YbhB/YbcL family Raf kinase inhibitor-like protein [Fusobacterium varium]MCD7979361.1 YbhB/YbcL family Raf kinase inhibitor-like protein [Fusobacterium sp.]MCF0170106.1 YbhB/YbcL family Raf kinase inhibitor-like protein [Fusobacterium varium]MCF2672541.1 YbhB/YbcL family Raf kinase inhibitor-like protein [Fusobacterium varium]
MKKIIFILMILLGVNSMAMTLESSGIKNGNISAEYGTYGDNIDGMPALSIPLRWKDVPKGTKSFVLVMEDYDAVPVSGFSWIHWIALIPGDYTELKENASRNDSKILQGINSWVSSMGGLDREKASFYGGPAPPDKKHTYTFRLYALDKEIKFDGTFYLNEVYKAMKGHILGSAELEGDYNN